MQSLGLSYRKKKINSEKTNNIKRLNLRDTRSANIYYARPDIKCNSKCRCQGPGTTCGKVKGGRWTEKVKGGLFVCFAPSLREGIRRHGVVWEVLARDWGRVGCEYAR